MSDLRALLLTDVVDSTKLSEALGDRAMAEVWAAHDRIARDLLPRWRGREIDKTDGMLLMFDEVADAVGYARTYQRALAALAVPLAARAGIHFGPVVLRQNRAEDVARGAKPLEVDGLAKPTAARVTGLALGGQLLLTPEARAALGADANLAEVALRMQSHGHWVLKGVAEPVELFEALDEQAPSLPPADGEKAYRVVRNGERWLPVREIPNNLPQQTTRFIGRERELHELKDLLCGSSGVRLLTLLGMGGLGKTRLSLQLALEVQHLFPDGVWFIDLSPIREAALVAGETAQAMGVRQEPERPLVQTLCAHLRDRRVMLVVDNCEHLIQPAADLLVALLRAAPGLRVVASSREALRVPGELAYTVLPLPLPERGASLRTLVQSTAVRLFVDRARLHRPSFALDERDALAVAELVARLEGIPLALELAAARVRSLSVADINLRLKDRYKLLTSGARSLQPRQQTLRALVDWSYDLLTQAEQRALQRMGVFVGGFELAAAEVVCGADPLDPQDVVDLVGSLVDKSLATLVEQAQGSRYRMLETIREYALEKLHQAGDAEATAARHGAHFFALAKQARNGMQGPQQGDWLDRLEAEHDNLRAAMRWALSQGEGASSDPFVGVKLAVALQNFWIMRGHASEGRGVVQDLLAQPAVQAAGMAQAHALYVGAALAFVQSDLAEALRLLQDCLALRRQLHNPSDIAATLSTLAVTQLLGGDAPGALAAATEAVTLFRECGYRNGEAIALLQLGQIEAYQGRAADALQHLNESLALARTIKHPETEGEAELALGELALAAGHAETAQQGFTRSLAVCSAAGDHRGSANAQWALSRIDLLAGRLAAAGARLREALLAFDGFEMRDAWLACLEDHAALALRHGERELAVGLAAAAHQLRQSARLMQSPQALLRGKALVAELRSVCDAEGFDSAWQQGLAWDSAEVQQRALALTRTAAD